MKKYTYYLMKNLVEGKQSDNATMFDFESIHEIIGSFLISLRWKVSEN